MPDSEIDYSDIPPLTDEQLAGMVLREKTTPVSFRIQEDVLDCSIQRAGLSHPRQRDSGERMEAERRLKSA